MKIKEKLRLFIDPASISLGWALFSNKDLVDSGTIKAISKWKISKRLHYIRKELKKDLGDLDIVEVHIEKMNHRTHYYVIWAVGVIVEVFYKYNPKDDIVVSSWKSFFKLKQKDKGEKIKEVFKKVFFGYDEEGMSDDEIEACLMGYYFLNKEGRNL